MAKITDNLIRIQTQENVPTVAATVVTHQFELDIPRGYVAKLQFVWIEHFFCIDDFTPTADMQYCFTFSSALVNDPDDGTTVIRPTDTYNDVIWDLYSRVQCQINTDNADPMLHSTPLSVLKEFGQEQDIIIARNPRFNSVVNSVVNMASLNARCTIGFTLERVTDAELLEILDIL
jgi:hypothetical protein